MLGQVSCHELLAVLGLVEEVLVDFLTSEHPDVGVVGDGAVRETVHVWISGISFQTGH